MSNAGCSSVLTSIGDVAGVNILRQLSLCIVQKWSYNSSPVVREGQVGRNKTAPAVCAQTSQLIAASASSSFSSRLELWQAKFE